MIDPRSSSPHVLVSRRMRLHRRHAAATVAPWRAATGSATLRPACRSLAVLVALAVSPLSAQEPDPTPEAVFTARLADIRASVDRSQWDEAKNALHELLSAHEKAPYVAAWRDDIVRVVRACHFQGKVPTPSVRELFRGDVLHHDAVASRIRIRYRNLDDWTLEGAVYSHPMVFDGPFSVTLKGDSYPSGPRTVAITFDKDDSGWLAADFGIEANSRVGSHHIEASLLRSKPEDPDAHPDELMRARSLGTPHKPFEATVRVTDDRIEMLYNKKSVLRCKREQARRGTVAVSFAAEEIVLAGRVDADWLRRRQADELAARQAQSEPDFDPRRELPEWLFADLPSGGGSKGKER